MMTKYIYWIFRDIIKHFECILFKHIPTSQFVKTPYDNSTIHFYLLITINASL